MCELDIIRGTVFLHETEKAFKPNWCTHLTLRSKIKICTLG
jgi:hypothetical protein